MINNRADYWVSQSKKYCDFCKCWIADNKPSIEFHEKGRKHKENVQRSLKAIGRKSRKDQKETERMDLALKRMESAALEAYRKDIESNANIDISSKNITETLEQNKLSLSSKKIWYEAKKTDGKTFYWNTETNEKQSEPPACGYLTIAQQQAEAFRTGKQQLEARELHKQKLDLLRVNEEKQQLEEDRAAAEREKMKARRIVEEPEPVITCGPILEQRTGPYGNWKSVENTKSKNMDLQLPKQEEYIPICIPVTKPDPPAKEFKEKTIKSLDPDEGSSSLNIGFKKRKFGGRSNRNTRQRLDDD